jgi:hypothetical protein
MNGSPSSAGVLPACDLTVERSIALLENPPPSCPAARVETVAYLVLVWHRYQMA